MFIIRVSSQIRPKWWTASLSFESPARELIMVSPGADEPNILQGLPLDLLRRAVEIYLRIAYPNSEPPPAVRRRLEWTPGLDSGELLAKPPFERVGKALPEKPIFALRLGNAHYPHMKMQIQPWDAKDGFLLSVNTHDHALALDPNAPDAAAFMALQAENQRLKVEIEQAWDEAGLPTFPRYLRDYLARQADTPPPDTTT
jgi:hypothetical protein